MAAQTVAHSANGTKPLPPPARVISLLGPKVDQLRELRALLRKAQEEERRLTQELSAAMVARGLETLPGHHAVAVRDTRTSLHVDPARFLLAAGPRAPEALSVSVTAARRLLGDEQLRAISATVSTTVLRVESLSQ